MLEFLNAMAEAPAPSARELKLETLTPLIPNGFFTITFPDGSHRTLRVRTKPADSKFAPGRRVVGLLIGPDNTSDYEDFAFIGEYGVQTWKRFKNQKQDRYAELLWALGNNEEIDGYSLAISKRCLICNRTLSDPESLRLGIGPVCRGG